MSGGEHEAVRRLLGGYILGGLEDPEQERVDAHLSGCAECRAEVDRLAPVPELLQRLPAGPAASAPQAPTRAGLDALLRRTRRPAPRTRRRGRLVTGLVTAAALLVAAVLVAAGVLLAPRPTPGPQSAPQATQRSTQIQPAGSSPTASPSGSAAPGTVVQFVAAAGSALSGRATLTARQWGVSVALELAGLPGDGPFVLRVVGRGGQEEQAACWGRTTSASARVTGASSIQLPNVDKVTVSDHDGHLLGTAAQQ